MPSYPYSLTVTNPGAETGDTTGWTNVTGTLVAQPAAGGYGPHSGTYFFKSGASAATECYQDVAVPVDAEADVDAALISAVFTAWQSGYTDADKGRMRISFRDAGGATLASWDGPDVDGTATWLEQIITAPVPPLTRTIRLTLIGTRAAGTSLDAYWDDISLGLDEVADTLSLPTIESAAGLDFFLRPRNCVMRQAAGGARDVIAIADASGNGNNLTASNPATLVEAGTPSLNALPTISANGSADEYTGSFGSYAGNTGLTIIAVLEPALNCPTGGAIIARDGSGNRGWNLYLADKGIPTFLIATSATTVAQRNGSGKINLRGIPCVLRARYNGATGEQSIWINGILDDGSITAPVPATIANNGAALKLFSSGYSDRYGGHLPNLLVAPTALSDEACEAIEAELIAAYDLTVFEEIATSPDLDVHQGIANDGTYHYLIHTTALYKVAADWSVVASNTTPLAGTTNDHLNDGAVYGGVLYVPVLQPVSIFRFSTANLSRLGITDISASADRESAGALAIDTVRNIIWLCEWEVDAQRLLKYSLADLSYLGALTLSEVVPYMNGMAYDPVTDALYTHTGMATSGLAGRVCRIDPDTGAVTQVFRRVMSDPEVGEGMTFVDGDLLWLIDWGNTETVHTYQLRGHTAPPGVPTPGVIQATGGLNKITITQVTAPVGATTRQLYVATSGDDLPSDGPGAGATLIAEWDDELGDWVAV
jgi:hypothetical protein